MLGNLRKRWVLVAIFCTSLTYFFYSTSYLTLSNKVHDRATIQGAQSQLKAESILRQLKWHKSSQVSENNTDGSKFYGVKICRNSRQGKEMIVDEEGYVCHREDMKSNRCCNVTAFSTNRYACASCIVSNCCSIYEHCVSCCMKPDKRPLLEKIILEADNNLQQLVMSSVKDQFELCLSKCRTSSASVQHENKYRDSSLKYCFGRNIPELKLQ